MDPVLQFLEKRRLGARPPEEAVDWACSLLADGFESDAILLLAGNAQFDSRRQSKLISQILLDLKRSELLDEREYLNALEREHIADYYAGQIDGWALIRHLTDLYFRSKVGDKQRFLKWICLSEDAGQHDQGLCLEYRFDIHPFNEVLEQALTEHGFPRPEVR
jgi:hypothetical protein